MSGKADGLLYLLRHAKSSWDDRTLPDSERPLAPRGRHACELVADHLSREAITPELVLCSSSVRTRQTLECIRPSFAEPLEILIEDGLYTGSARELLSRLQAIDRSITSVMLIGHQPAIQELALSLVRRPKDKRALSGKFPTGALATLSVLRPWDTLSPATGTLVDLVKPRELDSST